MRDKFDEFANRYGIRRMNTKYPYKSYGYHRDYAIDKIGDRDEIIEIEISSRALEHLVNRDNEFNRTYRDQRDEAYMRNKYSAISEAYDKYRMLLELYR
jgi:hypothetical protein